MFFKITNPKKKNISKIKYVNIISKNKLLINHCIRYSKNIDLGVTQTRDLVTMPSNILNPNKFANEIKKLSKYGLKIEILDENKLKKLGMNALLGVGQGSSNKSYVGIMRWQGGKKNQNSKEKKSASSHFAERGEGIALRGRRRRRRRRRGGGRSG